MTAPGIIENPNELIKELDSILIPSTRTFDSMTGEAKRVANKMLALANQNGSRIQFDRADMQHLASVLGFISRAAECYRAALDECLSHRNEPSALRHH